jgi:2-keto-3-deoxy-L-rhamnonate aldolase RhmA
MPLHCHDALKKIRAGKELALGMGVHHMRGAAAPLLAKAAGFDWLFIDAEHGFIATGEIAQICLAALPQGVVPIVRICSGEYAEGTRALDNGALGLAPMGHRSTGGTNAQFGYRPPAAAEAQKILNAEILIIPMIETPQAVENADAIAAIAGIDALLIGTNDLSLEMGISGQIGHERIKAAYRTVAEACTRHGKVLGMGGVYDQELSTEYIGLGARLILGASDHALLLAAATQRVQFLRGLPAAGGK